jgi:2-oxoglutarate dehydrogenase E2 component (dihydrolipoamide succinyltransferase)
MPTEVVMPQMGESIFEGTITKWLKKPGDQVEQDEPLFEISTDKVDSEIPSPASGVLSEIRAQEGETVEINAVVAIIGATKVVAGDTFEVKAPAADSVAPELAGRAEKPAQEHLTDQSATHSGRTEVVMPQMGESIFEGTITKWLKKPGERVEKDEPLFEISTDKVDAEIPSPAAGILTEIKSAEGATVQINTVVAVIGGSSSTSGAGGDEISAARAQTETSSGTVAPQAQSAAPQAPQGVRSSPLVRRIAKEHHVDLSQVRGTGSGGRINKDDILHFISRAPSTKAPAPPQVPQGAVKLSKMRAIIAQRMVESLQISPHAHTVYKVDMTRVVKLRERQRVGFEQRNGVRLTYMPFIAAAAVAALSKFPIVNASLEEGAIHYHENIHLGIAVALEWGLIVPVIRAAETRSFVDLARTINDLAGRARSRKLNPDEAAGSTFTLTNSGVFGGEFGTPIINQPESAILAIGGLKKEPVVVTDDDGNDSLAIRSMQYYCLGFDHRTIDGADAGKFMSEFKNVLERWDREIG